MRGVIYEGEKTKENLDVIAAYVNDFAAIVDDTFCTNEGS